jgi:hypothetical protein
MSFEVLITVVPPEGDTWPPTKEQFDAWAGGLAEVVKSIGGSRSLGVYGPGYLNWQGDPAPRAQVNIWTEDGRPATWTAALEYISQRVETLESAGYDVSGVEVMPGKHFVAMA